MSWLGTFKCLIFLYFFFTFPRIIQSLQSLAKRKADKNRIRYSPLLTLEIKYCRRKMDAAAAKLEVCYTLRTFTYFVLVTHIFRLNLVSISILSCSKSFMNERAGIGIAAGVGPRTMYPNTARMPLNGRLDKCLRKKGRNASRTNGGTSRF